ncbi:Hypothetical protein CAP_8896 [Chondromyces apiculatus DSM 436]|uniref:Uncharacterized protein n=1 Tax=Chondromyces apiculatus DSM 436 TaxID=1192034 RepID=A0A017SVD2_9BACT|nr:Hypothetical protein CAP_8896 [Chondromyces apiculatus DSM 436]
MIFVAACGETQKPGDGGPAGYNAYQCPAPVGEIVREDCSQLGLNYDGVSASGSLDVGGVVGASGEYKQQAIRAADTLIQVLKDQRVALCHGFNTCKMTVAEYRQDQRRIDDTFAFVATITERLKSMSGDEVQAVLRQLNDIRTSGTLAGRASGEPLPQLPPPSNPAVDRALPARGDPSAANAWRPGMYMMQAVGRVAAMAHQVEQKTTLGFDRDHACVLGAFVKTRSIQSMWQTFNGGVKYALIGGGEDNAIDVDIGIADENGRVLVSDTADDANPVVEFTPPASGRYEIRLSLADSKASGSFVAMALMQDGGYAIPANRLLQSFSSAIRYGSKLSEQVQPGLVFHGGGDWAFFGTVLEPNQSSTFSGIDVAGTPTVALAAGDDSSLNLDLEVRDGSSDRVVVVDKDKDAVPNTVIQPGNYKVLVQNPSSNGATMVTLLLLDVAQ